MPRINKKTRAKGLPPKISIKLLESITGSHPTVSRISPDNRIGKYNINFNDDKTVVYNTYDNLKSISMPTTLPVGNSSLNSELTSSLTFSGQTRKGVGDNFVTINSTGQDIQPFKEKDLFAVDGKTRNTSYYSTGSKVEIVGKGFSNPLWNKTQINIDINISQSSSLSLVSGTVTEGLNYPMGYYNFERQVWEGIGKGRPVGSFNIDNSYIDDFYMGFSPSVDLSLPNAGVTPYAAIAAGSVVGTFGFPYHPKYHATSSQTLKISNYIDKPFLLEKIVLNISASYNSGNISTSTSYISGSSITTFFLLNQKKNNFINLTKSIRSFNNLLAEYENFEYTLTLPTSSIISNSGSTLTINTLRDIISFYNISSFNSQTFNRVYETSIPEIQNITGENLLKRDFSIVNSSSMNWNQELKLEMETRSPVYSNYFFSDTREIDLNASKNVFLENVDGGRDGLGLKNINGRSLTSTFPDSENYSVVDNFIMPKNFYKYNPYLLLPGDELILGCQVPYMQSIGKLLVGSGSILTFHPGQYKMTLYGCTISENKEKNDTLNQLLTSNTIYEDIG